MSGNFKGRSNMYSDFISTDYRVEIGTVPSAPPLHPNLAEPPGGGSSNDTLYPSLGVVGRPPSLLPSQFSVNTAQEYEVVVESTIPMTDEYSKQATRIGRIEDCKTKVMGMVLIDHLFCVLHKRSNVLWKYDVSKLRIDCFVVPPVSNQSISGLQYPRGMAAKHRTKDLFITDRRRILGTKGGGRIMKVSLGGVVVAYADFDYEPFGVSVSKENERIIIACCKNTCRVSMSFLGAGYILIYEEANARLAEVHLIALEESVEIPRHAVEAPRP